MNRREFGRCLGVWGVGAVVVPGAAWAAAGRGVVRQQARVDGARLLGQLQALSRFGALPGGGISRVAYSEADLAARAQVRAWMQEAGLEVATDAAGNLVGRRAGREPGLKPIAIGSHIDSVPQGGNYDGPVGSLGAIEVARTLHQQQIALRHPLEVLIFQNEEGGLYGSRLLYSELPDRELELKNASGHTVREGIRLLGGDPERLAEARREPGSIAAFVELHIEQGGILERSDTDIGVVQGIVGIGWWDVVWEGFANHAGTTPMEGRQDALVAAARFVEAVSRVAREIEGRQVATVGRIAAEPGAPNVIPGRVVHSLEVRDLGEAKMRAVFERLRAEAERIAADAGVRVSFRELNWLVPAPADPRVQSAVADAAAGLGLSTRAMPSGAGHDAQSMARLGPAGMIFVPSIGGISHSPRERTTDKDVVHGANTLLQTVLRLDRSM